MLHFLLHACFGACYATSCCTTFKHAGPAPSCLNACGVVFFLVALAGYSALLVVVQGGTALVILGALLAVDATISLGFHAYKLRQASAKAAQQSGGAGGAQA